jgi:hypothetical protein
LEPDDKGLTDLAFVELLKRFVEGDDSVRGKIAKIAASSRRRLSRGPKVLRPSAAHEFIKEGLREFPLQRVRRTRSKALGAQVYVDALTEATRQEFNVPTFAGRPAWRRIKRRRRSATKEA